ncbi:glycosyltransferase N-terminal domain-containing protein [Acetobacteraceae bacterium ESL0709]|nr:glycosyltransferase N-terminal domain-containing protein [Acetobacteraceae bacterium ESL0697]MDF7678241.1 glycosyltransferase N-terminal domain-containing protein [Acetobacteraceae bacterium ESL0709]
MACRGMFKFCQAIFFALWDLAGVCLLPGLMAYGFWRLKKGKELSGRLKERFGFLSPEQRAFFCTASQKKVWLHAASVGETLSAFPLIDALLESDKKLDVILTTMTITGYQIVRSHPAYGKRLIHAFLPYDTPLGRTLFLNHWAPSGAVFIESEIWPGIPRECARRHIPFMLVNARLSEHSARNWSHFRMILQAILAPARWIIPRDTGDQRQFQKLGIPVLDPIGDLKADAAPLKADPMQLASLQAKLGNRPIFVALSTHEGEEEIIIAALKEARTKEPELLGVIVPRHPERGATLAAQFNAPRRSLGEFPTLADTLWIIDTLGEVGLFLNLAQSAFIGKSLCLPGGGHNPFEPLKAGCRTACGPYMSNWDDSCFHLRDYLTVLKTDAAIAKWITEDRIPPVPYVFEKKNLSFRLACQILTTISDNK